MKQLHILTVGISLLTNYAKTANLSLEAVLKRSRQLKDFLKSDPRAACSEINSLDARTGFLRKKLKGFAVTLVYSATSGKESQLTARLIGNFLKLNGVEVMELKLKDIGVPANPQADPVEAARLAEAGLIQLYDKLEAHIHKLRQRHPQLEIELNATGGFKAEAAILYGVGLSVGVRVYYLHESYRVPITLPVCDVPF
jgi:putative CRISPR-associated protein (TIGR02619 family)